MADKLDLGYIDYLEVNNFKSYRGTHRVGPFRNFTAIVGPNGAGKSNVMDAISFVLGLDVKKLRGDSLGDLVNERSRKEKEKVDSFVRLVFVTGDGERLHFKRSIVLSTSATKGETWKSVYQFQEETGRAIYEAGLAQMGISAQHPNFLVFQKQVENVARKSPKELTALFEHISGSEEYRENYDACLKEREVARENAVFLEKKKKGLKSEQKEFKDQKKEADAHKELSKQFKDLKLRQLLFQLFYLDRDITKLNDELSAKRREVSEVITKLSESDKKVPQLRSNLATSQKTVQASEMKLAKEERALEEAVPQLHIEELQKVHVERKLEAAKNDLKREEEKLKAAQAKREQLESELADLEEKEVTFKKQNEEAMKVGGKSLSPAEMKEFGEVKEKARGASASLRSALMVLEREQESDLTLFEEVHKPRREELQEKARILKDQDIPAAKRRVKSLEETHASVKTELTTLQAERGEIEASNAEALETKTALEAKINEIQEDIKKCRVDLSTNERQTRMEDCLQAMKRLFPGVHGRIFDLVEPAQDRYKYAVTVALGPHMDSIVVADHTTAIECIHYMQEQRIGVATFIPLDSIRSNVSYDRLRVLEPGAIRPIIDVIKYDAMYQSAMEFVCGNTLVCADLDKAREWAFNRGQQRHKVVTFEGILIAKSGFMTGGISGLELKAGRWDAKQLQRLMTDRDAQLAKLQTINAQMRNVSRERELQTLCATLEAKLQSLGLDMASANATLTTLNKNLADTQQQLDKTKAAYQKLEKDISSRKPKLDDSKQSIAEAEDDIYKPFAQRVGIPNIREWDETRKSGLKEFAEKGLVFKTQRARIQNLLAYAIQQNNDQEVENLRSQCEELAQKLEETINAIEEKRQKIEVSRGQITKLRKDYEKAHAECDEHDKLLKTASRDSDARKAIRAGLNKIIDAKDAALEQLKGKRHQVYSSANEDDIQLPVIEKIEGRVTTVMKNVTDIMDDAKLASVEEEGMEDEPMLKHTQSMTSQEIDGRTKSEDKITIDFDELHKEFKDCKTLAQREEKLSAIVADVQSCAARLELIAPNYKASGKLTSVQENLDDIEQQIKEAHETAEDARNRYIEVRAKRNKEFTAAFDVINSTINQVYKALTGGFGQAMLESSVDEPYAHPITYSLSPKGKAYTDIQHLSGGEQSVAALALLFAIQGIKPSPFFVLDEIDAALDSDNVSTVAQYFKTRSSEMQFIVISLKDKCFDKADALVGVYLDRQEGTSKHLTLDLNALCGEHHV